MQCLVLNVFESAAKKAVVWVFYLNVTDLQIMINWSQEKNGSEDNV